MVLKLKKHPETPFCNFCLLCTCMEMPPLSGVDRVGHEDVLLRDR